LGNQGVGLRHVAFIKIPVRVNLTVGDAVQPGGLEFGAVRVLLASHRGGVHPGEPQCSLLRHHDGGAVALGCVPAVHLLQCEDA
jgi:hypothetical protein